MASDSLSQNQLRKPCMPVFSGFGPKSRSHAHSFDHNLHMYHIVPLQIMVKTVGLGSGNFGQPKSGFLINVHFHIPFQKTFLQYQRSLENLPSSHLLTSFSVF